MFRYVVKREVEPLMDIALLMPARPIHRPVSPPMPEIPGVVFETPFAMMSRVPFLSVPEVVAAAVVVVVVPKSTRGQGAFVPRVRGPPVPTAPPGDDRVFVPRRRGPFVQWGRGLSVPRGRGHPFIPWGRRGPYSRSRGCSIH